MRILIMLTALIGLAACGPSAREQHLERLATLQEEVFKLEREAGGDSTILTFVNDSRARITEINNLLLEGDNQSAGSQLDSLAAAIARFAERAKPGGRSGQFGTVTYVAKGDDVFEAFHEQVDLNNVARLRTGIRSLLALPLSERLHLRMGAQTEVALQHGGGRIIGITLLKGVIDLIQENGSTTAAIDDLSVDLEGSVTVHMTNPALLDARTVAVHQGSANWRTGGEKGFLKQNEGLYRSDDRWKTARLPVAPNLIQPEEDEVLGAGDATEIPVSFSWSAPALQQGFNLQISKRADFATRIHDSADYRAPRAEVSLEVGAYFWRVRALGDGGPSGPFSEAYPFEVKPIKVAQKQQTRRVETTRQGPPLTNVDIELISDTAIITGRTTPGSVRVTVNDVTAIVMSDGAFRSVLSFPQGGEQEVRIIARDQGTGAQTEVVKTVNIRNQ